MKKIKFMDCSFRDGFQSCLGARVKTDDFLPALDAAVKAGIDYIEIGGGARFQSLYFYCQEDAFEMMDRCREVVGPNVNLQTLARGVNVVGLSSQSSDIIELHAKLFKKHGITTIRNFDALNDVRNLTASGKYITQYGLKHQATVTMMGLAPGLNEPYAHTPNFYIDRLKEILASGMAFDSLAFKDASGTSTPKTVYETIKQAREILDAEFKGDNRKSISFHTHDTAGMAVSCNMAAIEAGADVIDLAMSPLSGGTCEADILVMYQRLRGTDQHGGVGVVAAGMHPPGMDRGVGQVRGLRHRKRVQLRPKCHGIALPCVEPGADAAGDGREHPAGQRGQNALDQLNRLRQLVIQLRDAVQGAAVIDDGHGQDLPRS